MRLWRFWEEQEQRDSEERNVDAAPSPRFLSSSSPLYFRSTNPLFAFTFDAMAKDKDTPKAIIIIVFMLGLLAALLTFANHVRPH